MARPEGSRNAGYEEERRRLADRILQKLTEPDGTHTSLRALATYCGVSAPTLRHYFNNRQGAITAAFEYALDTWSVQMTRWAKSDLGPLDQSLPAIINNLVKEWERSNLDRTIATGLAIGLSYERHRKLANHYILSPLFETLSQRLRLHQQREELDESLDTDLGARILLAPILLFLVEHHMDETYEEKIQELVDIQISTFINAWAILPHELDDNDKIPASLQP